MLEKLRYFSLVLLSGRLQTKYVDARNACQRDVRGAGRAKAAMAIRLLSGSFKKKLQFAKIATENVADAVTKRSER